jgi:nucleotide-binding universal stress UspA family protein
MSEVSRSCFYSMQSVFVASDFLQYATQALYQAFEVSQAACASLTCFHALEKFPSIMRDILFPYAALGSDEVEILNEVRNGIQDRGNKYLEKVMEGNASHVRLKVDFSRDSMAKSILHAASECNADLMFCGSYGTKPHTTGIIGSMAATFVAYTRIPLYLIKDPTHRGKHKKILVAFLDPELSPKLLAWAVSFAMFYPDSDVEIVTPVPDLTRADPYGDYQGFSPAERQIKAATERITQKAKIAVQSLSVPFVYEQHANALSFRQHAPVMPAASAVLTVADKIGADLIVIPSTQPSLNVDNTLRENARNITEYANQNCLIIPSNFLK